MSTLPTFEPQDIPTLTRLARLGRLAIVTKREDAPDCVTVGVCVDADIERVWEVVTDYANFPRFMPQTEGAAARSNPDGTIDVELTTVVKLTVFRKKVSYILRHQYDRPHRIDFKGIGGDLRFVEGYWRFEPVGENETLLLHTTCMGLEDLGRTMRLLLSKEPMLDTSVQTAIAMMVAEAVKSRA